MKTNKAKVVGPSKRSKPTATPSERSEYTWNAWGVGPNFGRGSVPKDINIWSINYCLEILHSVRSRQNGQGPFSSSMDGYGVQTPAPAQVDGFDQSNASLVPPHLSHPVSFFGVFD